MNFTHNKINTPYFVLKTKTNPIFIESIYNALSFYAISLQELNELIEKVNSRDFTNSFNRFYFSVPEPKELNILDKVLGQYRLIFKGKDELYVCKILSFKRNMATKDYGILFTITGPTKESEKCTTHRDLYLKEWLVVEINEQTDNLIDILREEFSKQIR